ncbi:uroporphyrinogen-III synthase [Pseudomethylobacillus aquaticus]|uniref:Uroporphyrinogen-III synthase n=1 Tax=Pseudomethylobacillus aquaticus TaxID=2676064 RepID=A0A3N0V326_9PROT|nr:uroporphyrinogen-III synthase [Pseudomethylobacillus aquaticus]ROH86868.1 uroporphyrinogen-III synthase [Pseudomethylobacillus aquaticus]
MAQNTEPGLGAGQALQGRSIVITRPPGQAGKLSALIRAQGGTPVLLPLIAIAALQDDEPLDQQLGQLDKQDWLIFISTNAVEYGMPKLLQHGLPHGVRFAAIGPQTAGALQAHGIGDVLIPQGRFDSEALLALPQMHAVAGQQVMIVRGVGGREVLAETLRARGANVCFAECYRRINPQKEDNALKSLWQNAQMDALVVTSSEAMRHLQALAGPWLKEIRLCVNHARIAESLPVDAHVFVAQAPGDEAMLNCLIAALQDR